MRSHLRVFWMVLGGFFLSLLYLQPAESLPMWGRKYNADCSMCHGMFPQLNPTGHKFRRMGYKMPDEFDKPDVNLSAEELKHLSHYFSARGRAQTTLTRQEGTKTKFNFEQKDVTLFYAGPVSKNVGFFFELPFEPAEGHAFLEVGQINFAFGDSDHYLFSRVGQFHQFSRVGYGGLDRPIGLSNPRVFDVRVNGFRPRHDGLGAEVGYSTGAFSGLVQVTNGIKSRGGSVLDNVDENNAKDAAVLLEYLIPGHDGSVSLLYVYGQELTPVNDTGTAVAGGKPTHYHRAYLFADYLFDGIGLKPIVGGGFGLDNQFVSGIGSKTAALVSGDDSQSWFTFVELDQRIRDNLYALVRFDYDDVTNKAEAGGTSKTWMGSGGVVMAFQKFVRLGLEYQATDNDAQNLAHKAITEVQLDF